MSWPDVEDLNEILTASGQRAGVLWALGQSDDLNANLVRFASAEGVGNHVNDEVVVLVIGGSGRGEISIDRDERRLVAGVLALVPSGATPRILPTLAFTADGVRSISAAGPAEALYGSGLGGAGSRARRRMAVYPSAAP